MAVEFSTDPFNTCYTDIVYEFNLNQGLAINVKSPFPLQQGYRAVMRMQQCKQLANFFESEILITEVKINQELEFLLKGRGNSGEYIQEFLIFDVHNKLIFKRQHQAQLYVDYCFPEQIDSNSAELKTSIDRMVHFFNRIFKHV